MNHKNQEFLGVDVGSARTGIARGASLARLAEPLSVVPAAAAADELAKLARSTAAAGVVVGLPRGLNGGETDQTRAVRQWAADAKAKIGLPFYWQDEALTTVNTAALGRRAKSPGGDAEAAAAILQDFLDTPEDERVRC